MKKTMTTCCLLCFWLVANGQRYIGGQFSGRFYHETNRTQSALLYKSTFVSISPTLGKITKKGERGCSLRLGWSGSFTKDKTVSMGDTAIREATVRLTTIGFEPFWRWTKPLFQRCRVYGEMALPVEGKRWHYEYSGTPSFDNTDNTLAIGCTFRAGLTYNFHPKWRIDVQLGVAALTCEMADLLDARRNTEWNFRSQANTPGWLRIGLARILADRKKTDGL